MPFIMFIYALIIKWYLMHSRYALLIFPLMILVACIFTFNLLSSIDNKYTKYSILIIILTSIACTAKFQAIPTEYYYFDYTSPQPNFKSAYQSIPSLQNVISGFPVLCDWYYSDRWHCINAIRVDLIHDWKTKISQKQEESYTKLPYLDSLDGLTPWKYYFVIDDFTNKSNDINKTLFNQISKYWKKIYESGNYQHNYIAVFEILVT